MSGVPPPEEFLQPDFDGSSLKVAQLRGILLQYDITLPPTSKKADLVKAFEEQVQARSSDLLETKSRVKASRKGIVNVAKDGSETSATGVKRGRGRPKKVKEPVESEQSSTEEQEPPKRPRGRPKKAPQPREHGEVSVEIPVSAQKGRSRKTASATPAPRVTRGTASVTSISPVPPSAPSSSRKHTASIVSDLPTLVEPPSERTPRKPKRKSEAMLKQVEEQEEEEKVDTTTKTPKRPKTPRRSEESGFSDYNPFQSGSEEAAERERRRRKSSVGLTVKKPAQPRYSEPAPRAQPDTPGTLRRVGPSREALKTPPPSILRDTIGKGHLSDPDLELDAAEAYNRAVSEKMAQMSPRGKEEATKVQVSSHVTPRGTSHKLRRSSKTFPQAATSPRTAVPLSALFLLLLSFLASWKSQSQSIGYCDSGSKTNDVIVSRQAAIEAANACIARRTAQALDDPSSRPHIECDVSGLPLVPFLPRPTACAPCPQHAICEDGQILSCEPEYILSPNLLSIVSPALDGLPGLGPRAFPPSCKPDTARKRMIGGLAKQMEKDLAKGRGYVVCAGMGAEDGFKGQGERFGAEESTLRARYLSRKDPKFSNEQFEEIFDAALADLVEHDDVIESIDADGHSWYAAARTDLTLGCKVKLEMFNMLERWRSQLVGSAVVVAVIAYLRSTLRHRQAEKYRAEELVQVVLKRLQDQESLHYTDPVTTPNPFIPPNQLRDLVMPPKGSSTSRTRLWQRVQDLIEANANVSVREREMKGEIWKTWEWAGVGERHVTFE